MSLPKGIATLSSASASSDDSLPNVEYQGRPKRPRTFIGQLLDFLPMSTRRRRRSKSDQRDTDGLLKETSPLRATQRTQRSQTFSVVRKTFIILPALILSILFVPTLMTTYTSVADIWISSGILHLLQVLVGSARLFWDLNTGEYRFLPEWRMPGHVGEGLVEYPTDATRDVLPINCHSHNDYIRRVPLFDAISWGCTGVEADVWRFDQVVLQSLRDESGSC